MSGDMWSSFKTLLPSGESFVQALLTNSIVVSVIAWLAKLWAERRIEKFKGERATELEQLKGAQAEKIEEIKGSQTAQLEAIKGDVTNLGRKFQANIEQRMLVFKTHFDIEFRAYQEIWAKCDEAADLAGMTLGLVQRDPVDDDAKEEERINAISRYDACREALIEARRKSPFVTKEISILSKSLIARCINITDLYKTEYLGFARNHEYDRKYLIRDIKRNIDEIMEKYSQLGDLIRTRISQLYSDTAQ